MALINTKWSALTTDNFFRVYFKFYRRHHDSSDGKSNKPAGHRILTFFLYLNDVEEGGETRFTTLDIDVKPKKVCVDIVPPQSRLCCASLFPLSRSFHSYCNVLFFVRSSILGPRIGVAVRIERRSESVRPEDVPRGEGGNQGHKVCGEFLE